MLRIIPLLLVAIAAQAAERWTEFRSGPFEVYTSAGQRAGALRLHEFEQLRNGLEQTMGTPELRPAWPIRILVSDQPGAVTVGLGWARDAFYGALPARGPVPRSFLRACALLLIQSGPGRLPDDVESGLADLFSTLEVSGSAVILGAPPPPAERTPAWSRMHLLAVTEPYYGKLRTLIYNLARGVEADPACRNALGKSLADFEKEADAYFRAGNFVTVQLRRKSIDPDRDYEALPAAAALAVVLRADLLLTSPASMVQAGAAYDAILKTAPASPEALEGRALVAIGEKRPDEARALLVRAIESPAGGARSFFEYARLEPDRSKALAALENAAKRNPRWSAPYVEMAVRETEPAVRLERLATAAKLDSRSVSTWRALAQAQEAAGQFVDAAKSWAAAELAAGSSQERQQLRDVRQQAEVRRRQQEEEDRQRKAEQARQELEALKQKSMSSVQAAIDKANRDRPPEAPSSGKIEQWWDGPRAAGKVQGVLRQVDCIGQQARLVIEGDDRKVTRLLVADSAQISFAGGGERTFGCGAQKPARRVVVEYFVKPDSKLGTAGEVAVIEFP